MIFLRPWRFHGWRVLWCSRPLTPVNATWDTMFASDGGLLAEEIS